jgi:hypothetical protein
MRHPDVLGVPSEEEAAVGGARVRRGDKVVLRPPDDADFHSRVLSGRTATIERIYVDDQERVHLAATVDDDPGQELFRETGRYLFFFPHEVEVPA